MVLKKDLATTVAVLNELGLIDKNLDEAFDKVEQAFHSSINSPFNRWEVWAEVNLDADYDRDKLKVKYTCHSMLTASEKITPVNPVTQFKVYEIVSRRAIEIPDLDDLDEFKIKLIADEKGIDYNEMVGMAHADEMLWQDIQEMDIDDKHPDFMEWLDDKGYDFYTMVKDEFIWVEQAIDYHMSYDSLENRIKN